jgi:lipid II:glycine glycyltransferase (peptidoglycan interpeptide bridge formation enzyme)
MLAAALKVGKERRWSFYQWNTSEVVPNLEPSVTYRAHRINLSPGSDALFAGMEGATRRSVKKAQAHHVSVEFLEGETGASEYYRLHCLTRQRQGQPPQPRRFFEALGRNVLIPGRGFVAAARFQGRIVAAAIFLTFGTNATYKYAASDERFQHCRAGNLVVWEGIRRLVAGGYRVLDLGRTSFHNDGLRRFKLGWGAEERLLFSFRVRVPDGTVIPLRDSAHAWHTKILRRLPVPLLRLAGEIIYPYRI